MTWFGIFFLSFVYGFFLDNGTGTCDLAASFAAQTCCSKTCLASPSQRYCPARSEAVASNFEDLAVASFQRHHLLGPDQRRDGVINSCRMALRHVPQDEIAACMVLRFVWPKLGYLCHTDSKPKRSNGQEPGKEPHRARDRRARDKERGRNPKRNSKIGIKETVKQV